MDVQVKKVVRLTGLSVGLSPWNPISILFSIVLSFSNLWNRRGEMVLRDRCRRCGTLHVFVGPGVSVSRAAFDRPV